MSDQRFPVSELYGPVLQGEGSMVGRQTHFVRFGYCDGAGDEGWCSWCDSLFSVDPRHRADWEMLSVESIVERLAALPPTPYITLSGGNPLIHDLTKLCEAIHYRLQHVRIICETQATIFRMWAIDDVDDLVLSPKPPSAGSPWTPRRERVLDQFMNAHAFFRWQTKIIKVAVDPYESADLDFAEMIAKRYMSLAVTSPVPHPTLYLSCVTQPGSSRLALCDDYRMLVERVIARPALRNAIVLAQQHYLLYGSKRRT